MIQKQHWFDIDRILITDEVNNASVQLDIFHKDDQKKHEVYRADCLLSGDDGEESFHERLKADLEELETKNKK